MAGQQPQRTIPGGGVVISKLMGSKTTIPAGGLKSVSAAVAKNPYLAKYVSGEASSAKAISEYEDEEEDVKKKKRRKKSSSSATVAPKKTGAAMKIVDEDDTGASTSTKGRGMNDALSRFDPIFDNAREEEDEEDAPTVVAPEELLALKKKEEEEKKKPLGTWVTIRSETDSAAGTISPPRRPSEGGTLSPPRRRQRHDSPEPSPPRRRQRHDSPEPTVSPPRRRQRHDSPSNEAGTVSPPRRRQRHDSPEPTVSPPRRRQRHDSPEPTVSPPRRRQRHDSPEQAAGTVSPPRRRRHDSPEPGKDRMMDGTRAGLVTGREVQEEVMAKKREELEKFKRMDPTLSGQGAATVFRDRRGRKLEMLNEMMKQEGRAGGGKEDDEAQMEWGVGLVQKHQREEERLRREREAAKPFARSKDDEDLNKELSSTSRWGDPMARLLKKDQGKSNAPRYQGPPAPPNRFNIPPGHRWDGVDRSNGWEKKLFELQAKKTATQEAAYKWSVEDM